MKVSLVTNMFVMMRSFEFETNLRPKDKGRAIFTKRIKISQINYIHVQHERVYREVHFSSILIHGIVFFNVFLVASFHNQFIVYILI